MSLIIFLVIVFLYFSLIKAYRKRSLKILRLRRLVFLPYLYCLVALGRNHSETTEVKFNIEDGGFAGEGARLNWALQGLEAFAAGPVIELEIAVIGAANQHVVVVEGQGIEDHVRVFQSSQLVTLRLLPDANLISAGRGKGALDWMVDQGPNALLVIREGLDALALPYVP